MISSGSATVRREDADAKALPGRTPKLNVEDVDDEEEANEVSKIEEFVSHDPILIEEMMEGLALSMLIFLIADIRLMSATGRIATKYQTIAVESDFVLRDQASVLSGTEDAKMYQPRVSQKDYRQTGLSPAQIMAIVLIELKRTFDLKDEEEKLNRKSLLFASNRDRGSVIQGFDAYLSSERRQVGKTLDESMHSLLKVYVQMIGTDLAAKVPHIEARRSYLNLLSFGVLEKSPENRDTYNSLRTNETVGPSRNATRPMARSFISERFASVKKDEEALANKGVAKATIQQVKGLRSTLLASQIVRDEREIKETTAAIFKMGETHSDFRLNVDTNGVKRTLSSSELLTIMENAVNSRVYDKLDFMANFFREGTISNVMVKSKARVMWVNDWYPIKDLTYAIAVDAEKKRVLVVFRGAITKQDWSKAVSSSLHHHPNPIKEDYDGKHPFLDMHSGFHQYLLRIRKDTGTTKYDEIANTAHRFGLERIGDNYRLAVTGHSLGAALSTVFGMLASTDERFTRNGAIKIFTFGSPYVGGHFFADAFRHQEETGKVMYARFYNHNDVIAHSPANIGITKRGSKYRHVGIGIKIPPVPCICPCFRKWNPSVHYVGKESFSKSLFRAIKSSFIFQAPWPWQMARMHTLAEFLQRVMDGIGTNCFERADFMMLEKSIETVYFEVVGISMLQSDS